MHCSTHRVAIPLLLAAAAACVDANQPTEPVADPVQPGPGFAAGGGSGVMPNGKGIGTRLYSIGPRTRYRPEMHRGGFVRISTSEVYFIFYGNWPEQSPAPAILSDFVIRLSGSSYWRINTLYHDDQGFPVSSSLLLGSNINDPYSAGSTLSDADVEAVVSNAILSEQLPHDPQGIYVVVGSPDVTVSSGLGQTWCAFHQKTLVAGIRIAYAFIGHPARNPTQCAPQLTGPNGDFAADAMVSLLATTLSNVLTDVDLNAWYDRLGLEPADKCAWTFGTTYQTPNGALANIRLGGLDYLLPRLWVPQKGNGGYCAMAAP